MKIPILIGLWLAAVVTLMNISAMAWAQDRCVETLVRDVRTVNLDSAATYALSEVINQSLSKQQQSNLGITVPIKGVPVSLTSSKARSLTSQFFRQTGVQWDQRTSIAMVSQTLSANAVEAYRACVEGRHRSGPRAVAYDTTSKEATIQITWFAPVGAPTTAAATYEISGAKPRSSLKEQWTTGEQQSFILDRERGRDLRIAANIGGETDRIFVPYVPRVEATTRVTAVTHPAPPAAPFRLANDGTGRNQGPILNCVAAPDESEIDADTATVTIEAFAGNINETSYAIIDTDRTSPRRVCWKAFLRPLSKRGGGDLKWRVNYDVVRWKFNVVD